MSSDPYMLRREAERLIGEDRVPAEELQRLVAAYGSAEFERSLEEAAENHSTQAMALAANAARGLGWRVVAIVEGEVRSGSRQNGVVAVSRAGSQFLLPEEERAFAVLNWIYRPEDGLVFFEAGEYDLTRAEALARFTNRSKLTEQALASNFAAALGS